MIISHRHRFIFLHCRKVAGSSITAYLNPFLGPDDLQVGSWKDAIKNGGRYNRRFYMDFVSMKGCGVLLKHLAMSVVRLRRVDLNNAHKSLYRNITGLKPEQPLAVELKQYAPEEWNAYFKFCFVRNPYERAVSDYKWRSRRRQGVSFSEFLERLADPERPDPERIVPKPRCNWPVYTIDNTPVVDFMGRFERLETDFRHVCDIIGIPFEDGRFPKAKASPQSSASYREWYGERERQLVKQVFEKEIDFFGYQF